MGHFAIVRVPLTTPIPRRIFIDFFPKYSVGILGKLGILGLFSFTLYTLKTLNTVFVFSSPFKQQIRITDSFSINYADLSYSLIALSPHPTDFLRTHSPTFSKVRRNPDNSLNSTS